MKRDELIELLQDVFNSSPSVGIIKLQRVLEWLERLPAGCELGDVAQERANCAADVLRWADYFPDEPLMGKALRAAARKLVRDSDDLTKAGKR